MQTKSVGAESNRKFESHELAVRLDPPANQIGYLEKFQHGQIIVLPKEDLVVTYYTNKPDSPGKFQLKRKDRLFQSVTWIVVMETMVKDQAKKDAIQVTGPLNP